MFGRRGLRRPRPAGAAAAERPRRAARVTSGGPGGDRDPAWAEARGARSRRRHSPPRSSSKPARASKAARASRNADGTASGAVSDRARSAGGATTWAAPSTRSMRIGARQSRPPVTDARARPDSGRHRCGRRRPRAGSPRRRRPARPAFRAAPSGAPRRHSTSARAVPAGQALDHRARARVGGATATRTTSSEGRRPLLHGADCARSVADHARRRRRARSRPPPPRQPAVHGAHGRGEPPAPRGAEALACPSPAPPPPPSSSPARPRWLHERRRPGRPGGSISRSRRAARSSAAAARAASSRPCPHAGRACPAARPRARASCAAPAPSQRSLLVRAARGRGARVAVRDPRPPRVEAARGGRGTRPRVSAPAARRARCAARRRPSRGSSSPPAGGSGRGTRAGSRPSPRARPA